MGDYAIKLEQMLSALHGAAAVHILPHNNPDPDAIASAVGLRWLLQERLHIPAKLLYKGVIGRAENRALVRYLDYPLQRMAVGEITADVPIVLVDTQPAAGNNALPPALTPAVVVDHHPWREETANARFYDVRPEVGASATMVVHYLRAAGVALPAELATALFYGIKTDTLALGRRATPDDHEAFCGLLSLTDFEAVSRIENAQLAPEYFKSVAGTLSSARIYDGVIVSYIGEVTYPDLTADMAELLLRMRGCRWVICIGRYKEMLFFSLRTVNRRGAGQLAQKIVGRLGTAGGHESMAGGQVPIEDHDPDALADEIAARFLGHFDLPEGTAAQALI